VLGNAGAVAVVDPRGAYAPRSCCSANVCRRKKRFLRCRNAHSQERRVSARRGFGNAVAIADAFVRRPALARRWSETAFATATRWVSTFRVRIPRTSHGGLTPPALVAVRTFAGEKTICAMHERRFTRAVGISPPWYRKTHLQRRVIFAEWLRLPLHNRLPHHGGLTPRAPGAVRTFAGEKRFLRCKNAHSEERRASARRGFGNAVAIADAFVQRPTPACRWSETTSATATRWVSTFRVRIPRTSHGGLTPPALVAVRTFAGKKRFLRCTNAGSQERRCVSPPWCATWSSVAHGVPQITCKYVSRTHGGLTPPALGAVANVCRKKTIFATHERTFTRAAGVSPPWYRKTHLQRRVIFAEWLRLPLHNRLPHHGGLTPPALGAVRTFAGEKRFLRCTNAHSQERRASARRGFGNAVAIADAFVQRPSSASPLVGNRVCNRNALGFHVSSSHTENIPRGADAPRSWCSANVCRRKNDFCVARTHVPKSDGASARRGCAIISTCRANRACSGTGEHTRSRATVRQPAVGLVTQLQLRTVLSGDRR
jgi:hypothetical protein